MSEDQKPREFRLEVENWRTNAISWNEMNKLTTGEVIHVIEYSAYEKLQQELESVKAELAENKSFNLGRYGKLDEINTDLNYKLASEKAKSKKLVEALEEYADFHHAPKLEEALAEYKGEK